MEHLPLYVSFTFALVTLITVAFLYIASNKSKVVLVVSLGWLALQAAVGLSGFYENSKTVPPRILLLVLPPLLTVIILFATRKGRSFLDSFNPAILTYLHVIRIPVEIVLFWLFIHKLVPQTITFEGRNFDIFSGITAAIVGYLGYTKSYLSKTVLIVWNFLCLALLTNVVTHAILAAPTVFQRIDFGQPTICIFYFPFVWLPCYVVPVVLLSHLVCLRKLLKQ